MNPSPLPVLVGPAAALTPFRSVTLSELTSALAPVLARLDAIEKRLEFIDERNEENEECIDGLDSRLETLECGFAQLLAKQVNSTKGGSEPLERVPPPDKRKLPAYIAFPSTLSHLCIAGNATLPNGDLNNWSAELSKQLLQYYGVEKEGEEEEGVVEEESLIAKKRRLRLARHLGITNLQINVCSAI